MATSTYTLSHNNNTDAEFRAWGKAISDMFTAAGWTLYRTNINWATITKPTVGNVEQGYEVWKSTDGAGKGLNDYYVRLAYGDTVTPTQAMLKVVAGWGEDGAGNLTGNLSVTSSMTLASTSEFSNLSVGSGYVCLFLASVSSSGAFVSIERTRTVTGAEQDELFVFITVPSGTNAKVYQVVPRTGTIPTNIATAGYGVRMMSAASAAYNSNVGVGDVAPQKGGWLMQAMNFFPGDTTNFTAAQQIYTFNVYGALHTYILNGNNNSVITGSTRVLMRYE
jgi:hypothetical protein